MNKLIVVTGPDGSGKSTLIEGIFQQNKCFHVASVWDCLIDIPNLNKQNIQDYLEKISPEARTLFIHHALVQSLNLAIKSNKPILFDSYSYKYFVSQKIIGDSTYAHRLLEMPKPDLILYLASSPLTALERKKKIGFSGYETHFKEEKENSFLQLQTAAAIHWLELCQKNRDWAEIPEHLNLEQKVDFSIKKIEKILK